jgi:hypothetical protein
MITSERYTNPAKLHKTDLVVTHPLNTGLCTALRVKDLKIVAYWEHR